MNINYRYKSLLLNWYRVLVVLLMFCGCSHSKTSSTSSSENWCNKELRPELKKLKEVPTKRKWFKVYKVGHNVYAIAEPYNYQEVISYLILGDRKALLFDSGMGLDSISVLVKELTSLPVTVLNSHTHYDHIGGNHEFSDIMATNTAFSRGNAAKGYAHAMVRSEVAPNAFCMERLAGTDTAHYSIKPFKVSKFIDDGYLIDLGNRTIKVIAVPGHAPDAIALLDQQSGYLWTGDTFYQGPVWLFDDGTDLNAYTKSIEKLASLATHVRFIFPAHNIPVADPKLLIDANRAFIEIRKGNKNGKANADGTVSFDCGKFSYLIKRSLLTR